MKYVNLEGFGDIAFPDDATDDEISQTMQSPEFDQYLQETDPEYYESTQPGMWDLFSGGVSEGFQFATEQIPQGALGFGADVVGAEETQKQAIQAVRTFSEERAAEGRPVRDFTDILEDPAEWDEFVDWTMYNMGNALGTTVIPAVASGLGAVVGGGLGSVVPGPGTAAGAVAGSQAGFWLSALAMGAGDIYATQAEVSDDPNALATSIGAPIYAAAERVGLGHLPASILKRTIGGEFKDLAAKEMTKSLGRRVATGAGRSAAGEASAEAIQGTTTDIATFFETNEAAQLQEFISSNEFWKRRINEAAAGAIGGAGIGGAVNLATEGYKSAKSAKPETSDETLKTKKIKIDPADFESAEEGMAAENAVLDVSKTGEQVRVTNRDKESFFRVGDYVDGQGQNKTIIKGADGVNRIIPAEQIFTTDINDPKILKQTIVDKLMQESNPEDLIEEDYIAKLLKTDPDLTQFEGGEARKFYALEDLTREVLGDVETQRLAQEKPATDTGNQTGYASKARKWLRSTGYAAWPADLVDQMSDSDAIRLYEDRQIYLDEQENAVLEKLGLDPTDFAGKGARDRIKNIVENQESIAALFESVMPPSEEAVAKSTESAANRQARFDKEKKTASLLVNKVTKQAYSVANRLDYMLSVGAHNSQEYNRLKQMESDKTINKDDRASFKKARERIDAERTQYNESMRALELQPIKDWDRFSSAKDNQFRSFRRTVPPMAKVDASQDNRQSPTPTALIEQDSLKFSELTDDAKSKLKNIERALRNIVNTIAPTATANLRTVDSLYVPGQSAANSGGISKNDAEAFGAYSPMSKLIYVALRDNTNTADTTIHEVIHYLDENGFFSRQERDIINQNMPFLKRRAVELMRQTNPNVTEDQISDNEALAIVAADYMQKRFARRENLINNFPAPLRSILEKLFQFINRVKRALRANGLNTLDDVFKNIEIGQTGRALPPTNKQLTRAAALASTTTQNFKKWFKNSVVRNNDGTPKKTYHVTFFPDKWKKGRSETEKSSIEFADSLDLGYHFGGTPAQSNARTSMEQARKESAQANLISKAGIRLIDFNRFITYRDIITESDYTNEGMKAEITKRMLEGGIDTFNYAKYEAVREAFTQIESKVAPHTLVTYLSIQNPLRMPDMEHWDPNEIMELLSEFADNDEGVGDYRIKNVQPNLGPGFSNVNLPESVEILFTEAELFAFEDKTADFTLAQKNQEIKRLLKAKGFDGIVYRNMVEGTEAIKSTNLLDYPESYIAFEPNQIKSVWNDGTYSPFNKDIMSSTRHADYMDPTAPAMEKWHLGGEQDTEVMAKNFKQYIPQASVKADSKKQQGGLEDIGSFARWTNSLMHMARKNALFAPFFNAYYLKNMYVNFVSNEASHYFKPLAALESEQLDRVTMAVEAAALAEQIEDIPVRHRPDEQNRIIIVAPQTGGLGVNSRVQPGQVISLTGQEAEAFVSYQEGMNFVLNEHKRAFMKPHVQTLKKLMERYFPGDPLTLDGQAMAAAAEQTIGHTFQFMTNQPLEDMTSDQLIPLLQAVEQDVVGRLSEVSGPGKLISTPLGMKNWKAIAAYERALSHLMKKKPKGKYKNEAVQQAFDELQAMNLDAAELKAELDQLRETRKAVTELMLDTNAMREVLNPLAHFENMLQRDYMPMMRYGDHFIAFTDSDGKIVHYEQMEFDYESSAIPFARAISKKSKEKFAQDRIRVLQREFQAKGIKARPMTDDKGNMLFPATRDEMVNRLNLNEGSIDALFSMLSRPSSILNPTGKMSSGMKELQRQALIRIKAKGFGARMQPRKMVPGYSIDLRRMAASYAMTGLNAAGRVRYDNEIQSAFNNVMQNGNRNLRDYTESAMDYMDSPFEELDKFRTVSFLWHLGGNISTGVLQTVAALQISGPYISQFAGVKSTANEFRKSMGQTSKMFNPFTAPNREGREFPETILDINKIPRDMYEPVMRGLESGLLKQGALFDAMGYAPTERVQDAALHNKWRGIRDALAVPFSTFETATRISVFMSSYRLAAADPKIIDKWYDTVRNQPLYADKFQDRPPTPYDFAESMVNDTLALFGKGNRPPWMRGVGSIMFQFQFYPQAMLEFFGTLLKNAPQNKTAIAAIALMLIVTSGLRGLPGADDLESLLNQLIKMMGGRSDEITRLYREVMHDIGAPGWAAEFVENGAFNAAGYDMQRRIGFGEIPGSEQLGALMGWGHSDQLLGAPGSMIIGNMGAIQEIGVQQGRWNEAIAYMMPTFIKNAYLGGYVYPEEGIRTRSGKQIMTPESITNRELFAKSFGFQPNKISISRRREREIADMMEVSNSRKQKITRRIEGHMYDMFKAMKERDNRKYAEANADFNNLMREVFRNNENKPIEAQVFIDNTTMNNIRARVIQRLYPQITTKSVPTRLRGAEADIRKRYDDMYVGVGD